MQQYLAYIEVKHCVLHIDTYRNLGIVTSHYLEQLFYAQKWLCVLITTDVNAEVKEAALNAGYWYLRKPVNPGALRSLVAKVADKINRTQNLSSQG